MRAASEFSNLLETAEYSHWANDTKNHPEATLGFDYYKVKFIVGGHVFEGLVNIANSENGRIFYDITKIKEIPDTSGKYATVVAQSTSAFGDLTNDSIPAKTPNVNSKFSVSEHPGPLPVILPGGEEPVTLPTYAETARRSREADGGGQQKTASVEAGNRFLTEADMEEYLRTGEREHVRNLKNEQIRRGESPILTTIEQVKEFIRSALTGQKRDTIKAYGRVGQQLASDIMAADSGTDVSGYYLELDANRLAHLGDHVKDDGDSRNIPLTQAQAENLTDYIDKYDDVLDVVKRKDGSTRILLGKKINGHAVIVELVSKGRRSMQPVTAWQNTTEHYIKKYGKTQTIDASQLHTEKNSGYKPSAPVERSAESTSDGRATQMGTVDTVVNSATSDTTIPQAGGNVKAEMYARRLERAGESVETAARLGGLIARAERGQLLTAGEDMAIRENKNAAQLLAAVRARAESAVSREGQAVTGAQGIMLPTYAETERRNRAARASTELERSGILAGVPDEDVALAKRLSGAIGRDIVFYREGATEQGIRNGFFSSVDGKIHVNAESRNPLAQIVSHELTHSVELADAYGRLQGIVLRRIQETGGDLAALRQEKRDLYARNGVALGSEGEIDQEIVAEYVEQYLLTDEESILELTRQDRGLARRILDWLDSILARLGSRAAKERVFLTEARAAYAKALEETTEAAMRAETATALESLRDDLAEGRITEAEFDEAMEAIRQEEGLAGVSQVERYSIDASYERDIEAWDEAGRRSGEVFTLGSTGPVLQGLGAIESDIYINGDKISAILAKHPEMTISEIQRLPEILEDPVLVMKSRNVGRGRQKNTRLVIFGTVKAQNGQPVMAVLDLRPVENGFLLDDMQKVNSTYTRNHGSNFIQNSEILYADKKRTIPLLRNVGFTRPASLLRNGSGKNRGDSSPDRLAHTGSISLLRSGFTGSISYNGQNVNLSGADFSSVVDMGQTQEEADAAKTENPSPGTNRNTALTSDASITDAGGDIKGQFSISEGQEEPDTDVSEQPGPLPVILPGGEDVSARDSLPAKARSYLERVERAMLNRAGEALGVSQFANRESLANMVRELSTEYLERGKVSQETTDRLFDQAYEAGIVADTAFYDQYRELKNHLRSQAVTIAEADQADIADFNSFRKSAFGTLRIVNEGGMPVDEAYQELRSMAPELFPELTRPGDQLKRMFEVGRSIRKAEHTLEQYHNCHSRNFNPCSPWRERGGLQHRHPWGLQEPGRAGRTGHRLPERSPHLPGGGSPAEHHGRPGPDAGADHPAEP